MDFTQNFQPREFYTWKGLRKCSRFFLPNNKKAFPLEQDYAVDCRIKICAERFALKWQRMYEAHRAIKQFGN